MHRDSNGKKIDDLQATISDWQSKGYSRTTYCSKKDWNAFTDILGDLIFQNDDGIQLRRHASIKIECRGGSKAIVHNRVIIGNPTTYAIWKADPRPINEKGWQPEWTYYPDSMYKELLTKKL